jgi:hypothetical protein
VVLPLLRARADERSFLQPVRSSTRLVIDGFPRAGNTFAVTAFRLSQREGVPVGHHTHMPAQILGAVRAGIPVLLVVREPEPTVLSLVVRLPYLSVGQALGSYWRFHEPLARVRDRIVVGTFEEVTTDFGAVVGRVNERFGTTFDVFEHTPENVREVMAVIEEGDARRYGEGESLERSIARPSEVRERLKADLRSAYRAPSLDRARARAERSYREMLNRVG